MPITDAGKNLAWLIGDPDFVGDDISQVGAGRYLYLRTARSAIIRHANIVIPVDTESTIDEGTVIARVAIIAFEKAQI